MDGLKCCEVMFSSILTATDYFRLESEYFNAKTFSFPRMIKGSAVINGVQYGTSKLCDESSDGYPVLRLNELHNGFIDKPQKYCHILTNLEYKSLCLKEGDVVIIRTNGNPDLVGRAAVVMEDSNYAFASYLYRIFPNGQLNPYTIVAFLSSKYGRMEINKNSMKGNQTNFSSSKFRELNLPLFGEDFKNKIKAIFKNAYIYRCNSDELYSKANDILMRSLNFVPSSFSTEGTTEKSLSESFGSTGRLDAEYYQPKYDDLFSVLGKLHTKPLGKIVNIMKSIEPGSEYYGNSGIPFIRVSDVNVMGIDSPSIKIPKTTVPSIETLYPKKDTILFSKDGSVGIAYKMEEDIEAVTSGALLHFRVKNTKEVLPDYLTLVLNSEVVQLQAERDSSGAIIQHWKPGDIEKVVIPILSLDVQREISEKVQESFSLRRQAEKLIQAAIKAVEFAIESDETTALKWIEETLHDLEEH